AKHTRLARSTRSRNSCVNINTSKNKNATRVAAADRPAPRNSRAARFWEGCEVEGVGMAVRRSQCGRSPLPGSEPVSHAMHELCVLREPSPHFVLRGV